MGTNTGIGIGIGIPFKNNALGGDRPYLPPELKARLIGVWDNYGKKNTDADRNIIKNKIPNAGGDLEILNAAYKLNSGFGEYKEDFTSWKIYPNIEVTDNVITTNGNFNSTWFIYKHANENEINEMNIKVSGIPEGGIIRYFYIPDETATIPVSYNISEDGVYHLPKSKLSSNRVNVGFTVSSSYDWNNIRIEQLSDFGGAFVTDGVNDMIISQKTLQEMGVTKDFTIVSMIHQISWRGSGSVPLTNYIRPTGNIYVRNQIADIGKTGIYGYVIYDVNNTSVNNSHVINTVLGDKNDYSVYTVGNLSQGKFSVQGYIDGNSNIRETSSVAHYWTFALLGKATEDDINLIIAYFNLDRTLKPDIRCNIERQGITNDNHADFNDKLADYSGNGRDIQMYNLAWKGGSGIAAKQYETFKDWTSESSSTSIIKQIDEFTRIVESSTNGYWVSRIRRGSDLDKVYSPINVYLYQDNNFLVHECKYEVDGVKYAIPINEPVGKGYHKLEMYTKDRYTELPENAENVVLSEWYFPKSTKGSIKYSIIPSCKGGILLDGINDFGKVIDMPIYKDYTFIIDREIISIGNTAGIVASKSEDSTDVNKQGAFLFEYLGAPNNISAWSFYKDNGKVANTDFTRGISYQSKYSYNGIELLAGTALDSDKLWLGILRDKDSRFANMAIYSLMSFPYTMSKFLIERQLKKHKLGTLYPNMVEFRPVIKKDDRIKSIKYYTDGKTANIGQYYPIGTGLGIAVETVQPYMVKSLKVNGVNTIPNVDYKGFNARLDSKSPQKITMDIQVDTNLIQWNPIITSTVELTTAPTFAIRGTSTLLKPGDWIPKNSEIWVIVTMNNLIDELRKFSFNGTFINIPSSSYNPDTGKYGFPFVIDNESTQNINLTIDEYIRFEDIVQPYPILLRFNDENGNEVSWGGKFRVGSTITIIGSAADSNLLPNIYNIFGLLLNDNQVTISKVIVEKTMVFKAKSAYIFDNNEPKCILSPRLLRIPNSSYKILGYIPDISGHGNHGVIHNSAYAEGSGVNEDGSYQFDGVDDFVTIPTIVGGKQVLMKVNWQSVVGAVTLYDQRLNISDYEFAIYNGNRDLDDNPVPAYQGRNNGQTYIDGILNKNINASELRNITHNITITNELSLRTNNTYPVIGSTRSNTHFAQMTLYDFMLFDEISTEAKIKELNEYVGVEAKVELPPYYWDNYGKTNFDADRDTIQQRGIAVGDYDLTNYNHAYEGMSGYNGYPVVFGIGKTYGGMPSADDFAYTVSPTTVNVTKFNITHGFIYSYLKHNGELETQNSDYPSYKIKVTGLEKGFGLHYSYLKNPSDANLSAFGIGTDGTYTIPKSFASDGSLINNNVWIGFIFTGTAPESCNVTIEVLPEYENGLVYDGVEDYSVNTNIPALTNYTYIIKRENLNNNVNSATMYKGNKAGGGAFIVDYIASNGSQQYSYGNPTLLPLNENTIIYGTKTSYNGSALTVGSNTDENGLDIGHWSSNYKSIVLYKLILYPKTIPLLQINFLKNLMEKDEIIDLNNPIFIKNE
jgi:hypothetical protein